MRGKLSVIKIIYCVMIRSNIDYGSVVYSSANKTLLKKIEEIQNQALQNCCGAFRSSPVASLQVEMEELEQNSVGFNCD